MLVKASKYGATMLFSLGLEQGPLNTLWNARAMYGESLYSRLYMYLLGSSSTTSALSLIAGKPLPYGPSF